MSCPIVTSREWKEFEVKAEGEFQAHALFFQNGFKIPSEIEFNKVERVDSDVVTSFVKFNKERSNIIFQLNETINEYKYTDNEKTIDNLTELLSELESADMEHSAEIIINSGHSLIGKIQKRLESEEITPELLTTADSYLGAFKEVANLKDYIRRIGGENKAENLAKLNSLIEKIDDFNTMHKRISKDMIVNELSKRSSFIRSREKFLVEKEFNKTFPRGAYLGSQEEYDKLKEDYLISEMGKREDDIQRKTKNRVREQLTRMPQDIGTIASFLDDPRGIQDQSIQLIVQMMDDADFKTDKAFSETRGGIIGALEKFEKATGLKRDQKEKYKGIVEEEDGKLTGYYVGINYNSALNAWKAMASRQSNHLISDEIKEKELAEFKEKYIKSQFHDKDILSYSKGTHPMVAFGKESTKNPQWDALYDKKLKKFKDTPQAEMWQALRQFNKDSDKITGRAKLGYRIPGAEAEGKNLLYTEGAKAYAIDSIKDAVLLNQNDIDRGATETIDGVTKILGNQHRVNLPYRNQVDLDKQSYDLVGLALANRYASLNYRHKSDIKATVEIAKSVLAERTVGKTRGDNFLTKMTKSATDALMGVDKEETQEIDMLGKDSNSYKLLSSIIEDRIYGIRTVQAGEIFGMDVNKVAGSLTKWAGNTMLIANVASATSNVIQGKMMNFLAKISDGKIKGSDLRKGEKLYWEDTANWTKDIGSRNITSKTNLLLERLVGSDYVKKHFESDLATDSRAERLFSTKTLHGMNSSAEHYIQSTLMYAILNSEIVDGKPIQEHYEVVDDVLQLKTDSKVDEAKLRSKVKAQIANAHGNYDSTNQAMAQRYWYGKLAFFLRKWIVRGVKKRWMGTATIKKPLSHYIENEPHLVNYMEETESFQEGTYTSAIRFMYLQRNNIKSLQFKVLAADWNELTDLEKRNIQATVTELAIGVTASLAATLLIALAGDDDDDENSVAYMSAYMLQRLSGEIGFYNPLNFSEGLRILSTPSATMTMLERVAKVSSQLLEDVTHFSLEEDREGNSKLINDLSKFNPFQKNLTSVSFKKKVNFLKNQ